MADRCVRPLTALAALGLALALLAAAAPAEGKLAQRTSRSAKIGAGEEGSTRALCPRGARRHLVSAGFASESPWRADDNSTIAAIGSSPSGSRGWRLGAANFAGEDERVTASVLCAKRDPRVRISRARSRVGPGKKARATARCRRREEAIAGGFAAPRFRLGRGPEVVAFSSRRQGRRRWRVTAFNNSGRRAGRIVAIARCAKRRPHLATVRERGVAVDQAPVELAARCGPGQELWSGGFEAAFRSFEPFAAILADRSHADGRRWRARFVGFQTGGEVTVFAYCARSR